MDDSFELPVNYKGEELLLPGRILHMGYVHKIEVEVYDIPVHFEWDDEHNLRALVEPSMMDNNKKITRDLLQAIAAAIEAILK